MRSPRLLAVLSVLACASALGAVACSSSAPPKKERKKPTVLITEYDDERAGKEGSEAVAAEMGLFPDPALDAYVNELGRKLLRGRARRTFDYHFHVVDQMEPNAFALPGGYIFISRGLLALANTEDQLANVIGHEITHAARRHAAAQQELMKRMIPLAIGARMQVASYGRDMEREADEGGQFLAAAAGYDPMGMSTFLTDMGNLERMMRGFSRRASFFDTHPSSSERAATNAQRARQIRWQPDPSLGDTRARLLRHTEGLYVDQSPEAGVFQGEDFLHPDMNFQLRFPRGWRTANTPQQVGAVAPTGDAIIALSADQPTGDSRLMAQAWFEREKDEMRLEIEASQPVKIGGIDAWRMEFKSASPMGDLAILAVFVPQASATFRIEGMTLSRQADAFRGRFLSTMRSFRPLTARERSSIQVKRLGVATAQPGETIGTLSLRTGNAWDPSTTAVYNGIFANHTFEGGELVKIARVETYKPSGR